MSCEPCAVCGRGCGRVVTPEGLACRDCAADLAATVQEDAADEGGAD